MNKAIFEKWHNRSTISWFHVFICTSFNDPVTKTVTVSNYKAMSKVLIRYNVEGISHYFNDHG
jgi:hypothetical protein